MRLAVCFFVVSALAFCSLVRAEEVLVLEQDYNIIEQGKSGPEPKDIRQILYITRNAIGIDEFGGQKNSDKPNETIVVLLKDKKIINIDHDARRTVTETFDARRKRIETRKQNVQDDMASMPEGPQKQKLAKLYRAMLDDKRKFTLTKGAGETKELAGLSCPLVTVAAEEAPDYVPLQAYLHPTEELPYDNSEVLYLLQIIGKRMADFLKSNKAAFKYVPMELHLDLAAGGRLDTKVVSVQKLSQTSFSPEFRGGLGNPFEVPEGYQERTMRPAPLRTDEVRPD